MFLDQELKKRGENISASRSDVQKDAVESACEVEFPDSQIQHIPLSVTRKWCEKNSDKNPSCDRKGKVKVFETFWHDVEMNPKWTWHSCVIYNSV